MKISKVFYSLFPITIFILGALVGWIAARIYSGNFGLLQNEIAANWTAALATLLAVVVALLFGALTYRQAEANRESENQMRLDRASALAVVLHHELHMVKGLICRILSELSDKAIEENVQALVSIMEEGLKKMTMPLLQSFAKSLEVFPPKVSALLLVVLSRHLQIQHNGPPMRDVDIPIQLTHAACKHARSLFATWQEDIEHASAAIKPYADRVAAITVKNSNQ